MNLLRRVAQFVLLILPSTTLELTTAFAVAPLWSQHSTRGTAKTALSAEVSKETYKLFSPCKINLFLRILRKREDGYHDLASLFQAIGFGDNLELTPINDVKADEFTCNMEGVPTDSTNLVLRAIQLMRDKTGVEQYFFTNLIKECPAQAGLGGGSANAATAMWGVNELMGRPATLEQVRVERAVLFGCDAAN